MSALANLSDAGLADLIDTVRDEIVRRNDRLRDVATPAARSLVQGRRYALIALAQAEERLRAGACTPLPAADLPVPDGPGVPRGRVVEGERDPRLTRGYHP